MSWQGQMSTIVRHLINDVDATSYKFSAERIETTILVAAQLTTMNVDFPNTYTLNVEQSKILDIINSTNIMKENFLFPFVISFSTLIVRVSVYR